MEMTPVSPADVITPLGNGAKPHGRDTSSSTSKESATKKITAEFEARETPFDPMAEALAGRLRMADPQMDNKMAMALAKSMLTKGNRYDAQASADASKGDVNVSA